MCAVCVWHGLARGKPPCIGSKRLRVCTGKSRACVQHARVLHVHTEAFLNLHTASLSISLLSSSLSSFLPFLFLRSLPSYFSRSLSLLSSLLSSLSSTMTMITRQVGSLSLCKHGSDLPVSECVGRCPFHVGRTYSHHARNNCPGITVQTSCHLE